MTFIEIKTLIDVTQTKATRPSQGTQFEIDQQRNFITLNQCIELRSVIQYDHGPTVETVDIKNMGFGTAYKGDHSVWTFVFSSDRDGVYRDSTGNEVGFLIDDLDGVPVIKKLTETINIDRATFNLKNPILKNTIIRVLQR